MQLRVPQPIVSYRTFSHGKPKPVPGLHGIALWMRVHVRKCVCVGAQILKIDIDFQRGFLFSSAR